MTASTPARRRAARSAAAADRKGVVDEVLARAVRGVLLVLLLALPVGVVLCAALTARRARSASFASAAARSILDVGLLLSLVLIGVGGRWVATAVGRRLADDALPQPSGTP